MHARIQLRYSGFKSGFWSHKQSRARFTTETKHDNFCYFGFVKAKGSKKQNLKKKKFEREGYIETENGRRNNRDIPVRVRSRETLRKMGSEMVSFLSSVSEDGGIFRPVDTCRKSRSFEVTAICTLIIGYVVLFQKFHYRTVS